MKYLVFGILGIFIFHTPALAQSQCTRQVTYPSCASEQAVCSGIINDNGVCDTVGSTECTCVSQSSEPITTPEPSSSVPQITTPSSPTISSAPAAVNPTGVTREESAVYKTNKATLPQDAIKTESKLDQSFLGQFTRVLSSFLGLFISVSNPQRLYAQSDSLSKGNFPDETRPSMKSTDIVENIKGFLGGKGPGFYGIASPTTPSAEIDKVSSYERLREKSFYPQEVKPITGSQ